MAWTPLFLNAVPQKTGTLSTFRVLSRSPAMISSSLSSPPSRYLSISASLASAAASTMNERASAAFSASSAGISPYSNTVPWDAVSQWMRFILTRSMTPSKPSSAPTGTCIGTAYAPRRERSCPTTLSKLAPVRSILLTNARRGTLYLLAWRHTVSDCGCTPPTAHSTNTAPSSTRSERSTSIVKSTRSEEQTYELQSLMRISYAVLCLKNKTQFIDATLHTYI